MVYCGAAYRANLVSRDGDVSKLLILSSLVVIILILFKNGLTMITIFYDGKCGLCSREINYYKKIAKADKFNWLDIATDPTPLNQLELSQADGLRRLHGLDATGRLHIGVDAFLLIWRELPYWRWLGMVVRLPGIRQVAQLIYNRFADFRFSRLAHCQIAVNNAVLRRHR